MPLKRCGMMQKSPEWKTINNNIMVNFLVLLMLSSVIAAGCASSEESNNRPKDYKNLVTITPPGDRPHKDSGVYVDSVETIRRDDKPALLITGSFPDGCTHIGKVTHTFAGETLQLSVMAWRNPNMMCTQVLTPFSLIYDEMGEDSLEAIRSVNLNGSNYRL